jgi:hypothetical protein
MVLVALHNPTIRQDHLCGKQVIGGQPVLAAEDPESAA